MMDQLRLLIEQRQASNADRETALLADMEQTYASASALLARSSIGPMIEEQAGQRRLIEELRTEMDKIKGSATTLSCRVKQLDHTLANLALAKAYMRSMDDMRNIDSKLAICIKTNQLEEAVEIVQRVHQYRVAGFVEAQPSFTALEAQLCDLVRSSASGDIRQVTKMLFVLGKEQEAFERYTEHVRVAFSNLCLIHVDRALDNNVAIDVPKHVEAVTGIFLHLAETVQRNEEFIDSSFGPIWFAKFLSEIEYTANAHAVRVIRALMKATNTLKSSAAGGEMQIRGLDFCLEELVSVIVRCKRFLQYLGNLRGVDDNNQQVGSLQQVIEEVAGVYVSGEHALISLLVERAIQDDSVDTEEPASLWSSVVEDAFFIFKKAMDRSLLTMDPNCACAIVNNITTGLQIEFKEYLEEAFGTSKRLFNYCINSIVATAPKRHPMLPVFNQRLEELNSGTVSSSRITCGDSLPHVVGNIAITCSYLVKFRTECLNSFDEHVKDPKARNMFQQCLSAFDLLTGEFNSLHVGTVKYILQQLRVSFIAPFISAVDNVNFNVDEAGFADMQVNDPYMRAFIASLESLVNWIKAVCVPESITMFLSLLCDYVSLRFEKFILGAKSRFSILGAAQLYQDISRLVSFFVQKTQVPVRVKFGRLQEMCSILCVESLTEFQQMYAGSSNAALKVTAHEAQTIISLRTEFSLH